MEDLRRTGKFLTLILRHHPEIIGITLDDHGWADVSSLIEGVKKTRPFSMELLEEIVRTDNKQRFSFDDSHSRIRANQGHSIPVDVELAECEPPETLYHGTGESSVPSIDEQGLLPMSRPYVHLSTDTATARSVGMRHGRPVIYLVESGQMFRDGHRFFLSRNGVWLTRSVPVCYLVKISR